MKLKNVLQQIYCSKDGKTLITNFSYLSLLQIVSYAFPFITLPYLAKVIGPEGFGKIAFAYAVVIWFNTVVDWGFSYTATRDVARCRGNINKVSEIFSVVFWTRMLLAVASFVVLLGLIVGIQKFRDNTIVILFTFLMIPGQICFSDWFFQAMEKMKYITILSIAIRIFFTLTIFLFIHQPEDYVWQPLLLSLGYTLSGFVALYIILKRWNVKIIKPSLSKSVIALKNSSDVFISNIAPNLWNSFSIVLLGFWHGDYLVGIYSSGKKFKDVSLGLLGVIPRTFFPLVARRMDKHYLLSLIHISISLLVALFLFVFAPFIINFFYTSDFQQSIVVLRIVSIAIIFLSLDSVYGVNYLVQIGQVKCYRRISIFSSLLAFVFSLPLVYYYHVLGASIIFLFANMVNGVLCLYFANKYKINNKKNESLSA